MEHLLSEGGSYLAAFLASTAQRAVGVRRERVDLHGVPARLCGLLEPSRLVGGDHLLLDREVHQIALVEARQDLGLDRLVDALPRELAFDGQPQRALEATQ